jgi:hypothetical protein
MRKTLGLLCAAALMLPVVMLTAQPAGAAGGTTCKTFTGTATFNPPLPPLGSTQKVKGTVTVTGKESGCAGGGVASATVTGKSAPATTGSNCTTLATSKTGTKFTLNTKWNNGKTSTTTLTSTPTKNPTIQTIAGTVTAGLFKGSHLSTVVQYTLPKGACSAGHPLKTVTLKNTKPLVIK